jgi:hypothetical protein
VTISPNIDNDETEDGRNTMRIYKAEYYVMASVPGISGFQRWDEREFRIVTGMKAANNRVDIVGLWLPQSDERYRIENGRTTENQLVADAENVILFLRDNPYQCAIAIGKAAERYCARYCPGKVSAE